MGGAWAQQTQVALKQVSLWGPLDILVQPCYPRTPSTSWMEPLQGQRGKGWRHLEDLPVPVQPTLGVGGGMEMHIKQSELGLP